MANKKGKEIDTSHLRLSEAHRRAFLHRDYLAHYLRWSHVRKFLLQSKRHLTAHLLDVGCGKDLPLPRMLYANMLTHTTGSYTGVDVNKLEWPDLVPQNSSRFNMVLWGKQDFLTLDKAKLRADGYDVITCFEMLEHVEPYHAFRVIQRIRERLRVSGGTAFLSTPVYDPRAGAAAAHVNEMSYDGFRALLLAAGLEPVNVWGTHARQRDLRPVLLNEERVVLAQLGDYYDTEVLSVLLAPGHPRQARNCIWQCVVGRPVVPDAEHAEPRHSSSARWRQDIQRIRKETRTK